MKDMFNTEALVIVYIVIGIFTFGHCYNQYPDEEPGEFGGYKYVINNGPGTKSIVSIAASACWPFYWSVQLQEKK